MGILGTNKLPEINEEDVSKAMLDELKKMRASKPLNPFLDEIPECFIREKDMED
jgi:hypothetical protein